MALLIALSMLISACLAQYPGEIPGPRNINDSIAIVGAGPAGIHIALQLKRKGFRNIIIYERNSRVGDLFNQVSHRGTVFESPFSVSGIDEKLRDLIEEYIGLSALQDLPTPTVWAKDGSQLSETNMMNYLIKEAKANLGTNDDGAARNALSTAMNRYVALYNQYFPNVASEGVPSEPGWEGRRDKTLADFLNRHGIEILAPVFQFLLTVEGLGSYNDIPALLAFVVVPANRMSALESGISTGVAGAAAKRFYVQNGFQRLWSNIVNDEGLNVQLNSNVVRLRRPVASEMTSSFLGIRRPGNSMQTVKYDFVIWTPSVRHALKPMHWKNEGANAGPFPEEYGNFLRVNADTYKTTFLADTELLDRGGTPIDIIIDNAKNSNGGPMKIVDTYAVYQKQTNQTRYRDGNYSMNADGSEFRTVQVTSFTKRPISGIVDAQINLFGQIRNDFTPVNVSFTGFQSQVVNPHFGPNDVGNSMIWKILRMQGKYGMWYVGESVISPSVNAQLKYNNLLINKMKPPVGDDGNTVV